MSLPDRHAAADAATAAAPLVARAGPNLARMLRFGIVGASGVVVNQGLLMLLHGSLDLPLLVASGVAIETSILTNFAANSLWTWQIGFGHSLRSWLARAARYHAAAALTAFAGNVIVLMGLVHFAGLDYRLANLIGIATGSGLNYAAGELWVFRGAGPARERSDG